VLFGFGREIFSIFFTEANILDMGSLIMNFIAITSIFQISQIIFAGALRGAGDAKFTLLGSLISVTIIRTLVTWGLSGGLINLGLVGIWTGVLSDQLSRFLLFSTRYRRGKWINIEI
ncbi:MAG: MATE family efflux transporter, partial [Erysipelotrichaceae bacterium]|nr:MATE family efflux transporter [Erysipelotrichaceae bacterium]